MPKVFWSDAAKELLDGLPEDVQREVQRREARLALFPELYAVVQEGRHRGKRRFAVAGRYYVYYQVYGEARDCFVTDIRPARAKPE